MEIVYGCVVCRLPRPPFQAWNLWDNLRAVSQAGCDINALKSIGQGHPAHRYDVFEHPSSFPSASCTVIIPRPHLHAQFLSPFVRALTASWCSSPLHTGPCPRVREHPSPTRAPAWSIVAWEPEPSPHSSSIIHTRAHSRSVRTGESLPDSAMRARGRRSARCPLRASLLSSPRSLPSHGGRFLARSPPLRLRRGALAMERAQVALLLMCEWERSEIRVRLRSGYGRYLSARVHLIRLVLRSTEVDGDGMTMQMEMEWERIDGDGVQVRVRIHHSRTLTLVGLRCGLALSAWRSLSSSSPSPSCSLVSTLAFPFAPAEWYGTRRLQAPPVRAYTRALAEVEERGCWCPNGSSPPSSSDVDIEAGMYACAHGAYLTLVFALALVIELRRWRCCGYGGR
ncbi:hypothetical protein B0H13DRAFT_2415830 [Mycena leptocephala]|nr:hypothetical protein B0H13DRAFT_2415830 [Mycena leptocephala]